MVTKNQIKLVAGLQQKKYRNQHGLFVAEGPKLVNELLQWGMVSFGIYVDDPKLREDLGAMAELVPHSTLKQMSGLSSPNGVLGVFHVPREKEPMYDGWVVALDSVRDPGNLGTIIRLCDWFAIGHLVCSEDTVDCYNPKVLQATMGSIARVHVDYVHLPEFLRQYKHLVHGAFVHGENLYCADFPQKGVLLMGNEANGISEEAGQYVSQKIAIPQFGRNTAESLNVGTATAILLSEIRRA